MKFKNISCVIGYFFMGFSLTMLLPFVVSLLYQDGESRYFLSSFAIIVSIGLLCRGIGQCANNNNELTTRDGFLIVVIFWVGISIAATLPFILGAHLSFVDSLFESISAFTTTGATVMTGLDQLAPSILLYRQFLQWLGGMGMIVLAVAVLPMLGIGGMQLYRAEAPGPMKSEKLKPRLAQTAQLVWYIYLGITCINALAYLIAGMTPFDAISHAFSTVSTGGFSTHDESLGWFNSMAIEIIAIVFMLLGAINFSVHFLAITRHHPKPYFQDIEVRSFLVIILIIIALTTLFLGYHHHFQNMPELLRIATFEVVSVITSTGFGTVDFSLWPGFLPVLLLFISFVGGCGGSTAGGIKVIRVLVLIQIGWREVRRLIHPSAIFPIRLGKRTLEQKVVDAIIGFWGVYISVFALLMLLMMQAGLDQVSAFSAIATCMNNLGPGLGEVANNFTAVSTEGKLIASVAMLLGRLEIFSVLVLLSPEFWRK